MRWLIATSLPCSEPQAVAEVRLFIKSHVVPGRYIVANVFDGNVERCREKLQSAAGSSGSLGLFGTSSRRNLVRVTAVPGHKTVFWKKELTPAAIASFDVVWLLDCDVRVSRHLFSFAEVEHWLSLTGASIMQPSVVAQREGGRTGRGFAGRGVVSADCLVREVPYVEQMTPMLRRDAFEIFWQKALDLIPDEKLGSDSGVEQLWCGLASMHLPSRPSCVVLGHQSVIHTNTHTIHKYDKDEYKHYKTKDALLFYLHERFEPELKASYRVSAADAMRANDTATWRIDWKNPRVMREWHRRSPRGSNASYCWGVRDRM